MAAEQFVLHHFREAEDRIERRAQFVAHGREESRLGQICLFRSAARFVGIGLGALEFADQFVFLGLGVKRGQRGLVEAARQRNEIDLRAADERGRREHGRVGGGACGNAGDGEAQWRD